MTPFRVIHPMPLQERGLASLNLLHTPVWIYDIQQHRIFWANHASFSLWEAHSLEELRQRDFAQEMAPAVDLLLQRYLDEFRAGRSFSEWWSLSPRGIKKQVYLRLSGIETSGRMMMICEAMLDADSFYHGAAMVRGDTIACLFDNAGRLVSGNSYFHHCFGAQITQLAQLFRGADEPFYQRLRAQEEVVCEGEGNTLKGRRWFQYQFRYVPQQGQILLTLRDITDRKLEELEHRHLARHDSMTGLLNRYGLMKSLEINCSLGSRFAMLFMDLDNFKLINDNFGHRAGDRLLERVASRLKEICPRDVELFRLGGDEFTALVPLQQGSERAEQFADQMLSQMVKPFVLSGLPEVSIGGSIGIAIYPDDADDGDNLITRADMAMYQAKHMGRFLWQRFTPSMQQELHRKLTLKQFLAKAIGRGELSLVYQPKVDLARGIIDSCEALLRWHNPVLGQVSPAEFIPLAEEMGLIREIGAWVLCSALSQQARWRERLGVEVPLAVNLSGMQITAELPDWVAQQLAAHAIAPHLLTLELTETVLMLDVRGSSQVLEALGQLGIRISIDDFGTGYSSLAYLNRLPINEIKLDRSFVVGFNLPVIRATVAMASSLGIDLIAEGVETEEELTALRRQGCHRIQGYLISRPMAAADLELNGFVIDSCIGSFTLAKQ
ncbi:putative bifunctional diguanylate cyclase/phosphodiesterase [Aeromonas simiae]|nr:EAL domain-containing protein [Aeromonas simiae]